MLSPVPKGTHPILQSIQIKQDYSTKNACSTWSPHSCRDYQEKYFVFKRKLLEAMIRMDPLSLLQSGIFQEYESSFTEHYCENKNQSASPKISHFESYNQSFTNKINTYSMDGLTVTQVERRSRSCERISRQEKVIRNVQEQRSVEFVLFSNLVNHLTHNNHLQQRECFHEKQDDVREAQKILELQQANQNYQRQQTHMISKIEQLQTEKEQLEKQLRECLNKLEHQKAISITMTNEKTNKQLEFLLKEKQLIKKIQQYKQENQRLRAIEQNGQNTMIELNRPIETVRIIKEGNRIQNLKEKVANEGRVRWALCKAWTAELNDECK